MATQAVSARPKKRAMSERARQEERLAYLFLVPSLLVVIGVAFYPLFNTIYVTFFDARLGSSRAWEYVGLENYTKLLASAQWWQAVWATIKFTVASVFFELLLGLGDCLGREQQIPWARINAHGNARSLGDSHSDLIANVEMDVSRCLWCI